MGKIGCEPTETMIDDHRIRERVSAGRQHAKNEAGMF
jgi:hypothetical protein